MDTLHFEPLNFHSPEGRRLSRDPGARRIDEMNLSEVEVFMLRGRRLQAQVVGGALRRAWAKVPRLLRRGRAEPGRHRHA
jgi:hypothetical protein